MKQLLRPRKGYALATILILLGICMFGAAALVTISILESRISRSQLEGTVAYYVAEAGVSDAVWRLNNNSTLRNALIAGTLATNYSVTDQPQAGQSFTVTLATGPQGAGYGTVEVVGTVNNGSFIAQRRIQASVFIGDGSAPVTGGNVIYGASDISITNGNGAVTLKTGNLYARRHIIINQASVDGPGRTINALGNYSSNSSTVNVAGIYAANYPPAPTDNVVAPGYNFSQYSGLPTNQCTAANFASQTQLRCTPTQLRNLIGSATNFTFNNQVVFVDSGLTFNSWARDKNLTFNGLLVVNGDVEVTGSADNFTLTINNPGNDQSGIVAAGNITNSNGMWNIDGIYYASGNMWFNNPGTISISGAVIAAGNISMNTGVAIDLSFNGGPVAGVIGGTPTAVRVLHWEEQY
jgi:Tfp pilus assembly protein PilX